MDKQVYRYEDVRERILNAVETLARPVRETISPKGRNVIVQNSRGDFFVTNDGKTIVKEISVKGNIENAIITLIKGASLKTESETGDGSSTSVILTSILVREGFKLIENGWNPMDVKREFEKIGADITALLKKKAIKVKTQKDLFNIAKISANSDEDVAKNVVEVVDVVGEDGMVFLEMNNKPETEIIKDVGFIIEAGLFSQELRNDPRQVSAGYSNAPVLITDKRIYYEEEAETILKTVLMAGHKSVIIVARDFIGQSVNFFLANHQKGVCKVLLVKDPQATDKDTSTLEDLAVYLGGRVVSEKTGKLVDNLTMDDFVFCEKAFADGAKTILTTQKKKNKALKNHLASLKSELAKDKNNDALKRRLASMTNGMVTIRVGGATQIETTERMYRYEDSVQATRAALKDGYLIGGGVTLMNLYDELKLTGEIMPVFRKYCEANVRQIAENCGVHPQTIVDAIKKSAYKAHGYNAVTNNMEDLLKAGVVDPFKVTEMAVRNSVSVAGQIISSGTLVLFDEDSIDEE